MNNITRAAPNHAAGRRLHMSGLECKEKLNLGKCMLLSFIGVHKQTSDRLGVRFP